MTLTTRSALGLATLTALLALVGCDGTTQDTWGRQETGDTDEPVDADDDGFTSDVDCEDDNPDVNPGQSEVCNEVDDNCDGFVDEGFDRDGDGHYSAFACTYGDDCDDNDRKLNPSATDIPYNRIDEDCSGADLTDVDGDGFDFVEVEDGTDCDDDNAEINPEALEVPYDGIDQDCSGADLLDVDGDGHDSADYGGDDCDDADATFNPSRMDWANDDIDQDCDFVDGREAEFRLSRAEYRMTGATNDSDLVGQRLTICDFDGDGADDLLVSAPFAANYQGQISIYLSDFHDQWEQDMSLDDGPDIKMVGTGTNAFFGMNVACGDVDGDGRDDVVATKGEINYIEGRTAYDNDFMLLIYYGDDDWAWSMDERRWDVQWTADFWTETSGVSSVLTPSLALGDLDGDGASEIILGFEGASWPAFDQDTVYIVPGDSYSSWEKFDRVTKTALTMTDPVADGYRSGLDVAVVPDTDGDSVNDLMISQPFYQVETDWGDGDPVFNGRMLFYSGIEGDGTIEDLAHASFLGGADEQIGFGGAVVADIDGSGSPDIIVAAPFSSSRADSAGEVYLIADPTFSAMDQDISAVATATLYADTADAQLGYGLFSAADLDGDGKQDLMVRQRNATSAGSHDDIRLVGGQHLSGSVHIDDATMMSFRYENELARTGSGVAVGDVTNDGAMDFFIGAPYHPTGSIDYSTGRTYFYPSESYPWGYLQGIAE